MIMRSTYLILPMALSLAATAVHAQNYQQMNNMLNAMDNASWQSVPVSGPKPTFSMPSQPAPPQSNASPLSGMLRRNTAPAQQSPFPGKLTKQDILRMFMGGSAPGGSNQQQSQRNSSALYSAQSQLQIARDQAAQAESAASRASYGSDKGARLSAASEAQNHANAARAAADQASSTAYGTSNDASDAAAQARNEANRAQAAADRAQANANGGGW
jgi:hypothetical protein